MQRGLGGSLTELARWLRMDCTVTSPARERETPLNEMRQLDRHLILPCTLLEI
jgi:hypothetical protein